MGVQLIETLSEENNIIPKSLSLNPAYPNPFNPEKTIKFAIPEWMNKSVSLHIYDVSGQLIETLYEGLIAPGIHSKKWNGAQYPSGIYFAKLEIDDSKNNPEFIQTQKLILIK